MEPLHRVAHLLVTPESPPRQTNGLDAERCIALHNAILEHAWLESGRSISDFHPNTKRWWQYYSDHVDQVDPDLHSTVRTFLEGALILPYELGDDRQNFFYILAGLHSPEMMLQHIENGEEGLLTLYAGQEKFASAPDGLVYDQNSHTAAMHWDVEEDVDLPLDGEKLESILSVYIEMILRGKAVALHDDVDRDPEFQLAEDGTFRMASRGPERDPETGARRLEAQLDPWTAVSWTPKDLEETLKVWKVLVDMIERKMSLPPHEPVQGIYNNSSCETASIPTGFAREFLTKAQKPRFQFIAPGLRMLNEEEFIAQPFLEADNHESFASSREDRIMPILLFRGEDKVRTSNLKFGWPCSDVMSHPAIVKECPVGLYFDPCITSSGIPFEDACTLILPYGFSGEWARKSDQTAVKDYDDLLQMGSNPYIQPHGPTLQAVLENAYMNVERGNWQVDEHGVAGGIEVWKDADTEQRWPSYWIPMGPGRFW